MTRAKPRLLFVSHHFPPDVSIGSKRSHRIAAQMKAADANKMIDEAIETVEQKLH